MSLSRFRSSTSLASVRVRGLPAGPLLAVALGSAAGCGGGGDSCGPGGAPDSGLIASGGGLSLTYGQLRGSPNRDCPSPGAPSSVIPLTIAGMQTDAGAGSPGLITLCIGRPDLLAGQPLALGAEPSTDVHVVDLNGTAGGCMLTVDRGSPPGGTASSSGLCGNGSDAAGFALVIDATLALTCGSTGDTVPVTLRGRVAVAGP